MKFKVLDLKKKTIASLGKDVIEAELKGEDGSTTKKVQIWQDFPDFGSITFDQEVEGDLVMKEKNGFTNVTLYPPKVASAPRGNSGMKAIVAEKAKNIEHSMDRKDNAIVLSSTFRDATILTQVSINALEGQITTEDIKKTWLDWRKWLLEQFGDPKDITETQKPF